jgi:phage gp29-like protein
MPEQQNFTAPSYVRLIADWTPDAIKSAIYSMSQGYYQSAGNLADAILGDDRVQAAIGTRVKALLGLPLAFEPADEKKAKAVKAAEDLENDFWDIAPEQTLHQILAYGWILGTAVVQIVWQRKNGRWLPTLDVYHPSLTRYDPIKDQWLVKVGQSAKEMVIAPGDEKWFLFQPYGAKYPWTNALIRSLAIPFLMKCYAVGDWARNSEVHGGAIKQVTAPSSTTDAVLKKLVDDVKAMGSDGVIGLREGQKLELLEVTENVWQGFQGLIAWADKATSTAILGQNMTTEPTKDQVGISGAKDVRQDILESDVEVLETALHTYPLVWWALFNYADATLAPYPMWNPKPQIKGKIEEFHIRAKAVKRNEVRESLGLPPLSEEEGGEEFADVDEQSQPLRAALASGESIKKAKGLVAGQAYVDKVVDNAGKRAAAILKSDVSSIMNLIDEANDPTELKAKLTAFYEGMSEAELAELTFRASMMAHLAGRYSEVLDNEANP